MINFQRITRRIFKPAEVETADGILYATERDLAAMRRYARLRSFENMTTFAQDAGDIKSAFKGRGIEMEELRPYQFGDDIRDIDWRITARKGEPYTKVYAQERNREIMLWLDLSPIMIFGSQKELKSVTAAKLAALLGWAAVRNKDRLGCVIFDGKNSLLFKPQAAKGYVEAICRKITATSRQALKGETNDDAARQKSLQLLRNNTKKGTGVFIISSFGLWAEQYLKEFEYLAMSSKIYLMNIYDELEIKAPAQGQYMAAFQGKKLLLDTSDKRYRAEYAKYFQQKSSRWFKQCQRIGCHIIDLTQKNDWAKNLKIF